MRITNQILNRRILDGLQQNLAGLDEAQARTTSGLRVRNASDDPSAYVGINSADRRLAALDQYRRGIGSAKARLDAEEGVLGQLSDLLSRARELGLSQGGANSTAETRRITQAELDEIIGQVVALGNTRLGSAFLFGGDFEAEPPFAPDGSTSTSRPPSGARPVAIGEGQTAFTNHNALEVFVDSGVIASLQALSTALGADSTAGIRTSLVAVETAFDRVQDVLGETGARGRQLEMAGANLDTLESSLRSLRSDLSEVEMEEAISQLISRQTTYQAALMATSRILSVTLTDYLR